MIVDDLEEIGIGELTAFARTREQTTVTATAPATPLEDGSVVNDHIINNPVQLTIEGVVSEIYVKPRAEIQAFRRGAAEIGNITKYLPPRTATQISKIKGLLLSVDNYYQKALTAIRDGKQTLNFLTGGAKPPSVIDDFVATLDVYHDEKIPLKIQTPDQVYENMVITSRVTTRDNTVDSLSFKITALQLRFAVVIFDDVSKYFKNPAPGATGNQVKGSNNKGLNDAPDVTKSLLQHGSDFIKGFLK